MRNTNQFLPICKLNFIDTNKDRVGNKIFEDASYYNLNNKYYTDDDTFSSIHNQRDMNQNIMLLFEPIEVLFTRLIEVKYSIKERGDTIKYSVLIRIGHSIFNNN